MKGSYSQHETVAFTGHRPERLGGYDQNHPKNVEIKIALESMIEAAIDMGYKNFITGMALGVDQWAGRIVVQKAELKLIAAIPCPEQDKQWPKPSQAEYQELLSLTADREIVSLRYSSKAMHLRNQWMVDRSSLILAVWDGNQSGGTYSCIEYALIRQRIVISYHPELKTIELVSLEKKRQ